MCWAVPPGTATTLPATAWLSRGGAVSPTHRGHTACPSVHLQRPVSQEGQEAHQGPEPRPGHPTTM